MSSGVLQASLAYAMWGVLPLYFHLLAAVAPLDIVLQRSLWSLAFVLVLLMVQRRWAWLRDIARRPRTLGIFALSALLLSTNWLVYVWAVNNGRVVESSLGYFITHGASGGDGALLVLLALSGPLTALPLLLFAAGARRIPLTTLGVLQYIGPTIQFALGVWLFREPFGGPRLAGFLLIWLALVIYTGDGLLRTWRAPSARPAAPR